MKQCSEGEEAYFCTYLDVAKGWKPRSAYRHWKKYGKREGKHYICICSKSEERVLPHNECSEPVKECPEGEEAYFHSNLDVAKNGNDI